MCPAPMADLGKSSPILDEIHVNNKPPSTLNVETVGTLVRIDGLKSKRGENLNKKLAEVIGESKNYEDKPRVLVRVYSDMSMQMDAAMGMVPGLGANAKAGVKAPNFQGNLGMDWHGEVSVAAENLTVHDSYCPEFKAICQKRATAAIANSKAKDAVMHMEKVVSRFPTDQDSLTMYAVALFESGKRVKAVSILEGVIAVSKPKIEKLEAIEAEKGDYMNTKEKNELNDGLKESRGHLKMAQKKTR